MPSVGNVYVLMWLICSSTLPLCFIMSPLGCCSPPDSSVRLRMRVEALSQQCVCVCAGERESLCSLSPSSTNIVHREENCDRRPQFRHMLNVALFTRADTEACTHTRTQLIVPAFAIALAHTHTHTCEHAHSAECKSSEIKHTRLCLQRHKAHLAA